MGEAVVAAAAASPGVAAGAARVQRPVPGADAGDELPARDRDGEAARAAAALEQAAARLAALARDAAAAGRADEAEMIDASAMMARDPLLCDAVEEEVRDRGRRAPAALVAAAEQIAATLAALDDPMLAARADDVRSVGRRAARIASDDPTGRGGGDARDYAKGHGEGGSRDDAAAAADSAAAAEDPVVVIADDLGPADVAELGDDVCAIALARGAITAHAAIVARARGIPMIVAAGETAVEVPSGSEVVVDGDAGRLVIGPEPARLDAARAAMRARAEEQARSVAERDLPAVTRDGRVVRVLCNAASAVEVRVGLAAGAEGAGLIRTELAFLDAPAWPTQDEHMRELAPVLEPLSGRTATVRVLDFGGDKTPPFLDGTPARGLDLLLRARGPFTAQVIAILRASAGARCDLRVLLPMVETAADLAAARALIDRVADELPGIERPLIGAMIETPGAAAAAAELTLHADFLSIGTNDLTHAILGSDRFTSAEARTEHPDVLAAIDASVRAAHAAGMPIEVCGEAASDPAVMPLLVDLGVDELSVGAARVGPTRAAIRALDGVSADAGGASATR